MAGEKVQYKGSPSLNDGLTAKLEAVVVRALKFHATKDLPLIYRNQLCKQDNQFIHEYPNGKKYLIQQDRLESEKIIVRQL